MKTTRFALVACAFACTLALGACNKASRTDAAASTTEVKACEKGAECCKTTGKACADGSSCSKDKGACSSSGSCSDAAKTTKN
ncbi:MAG: hypothetical protein K2X32_13390 [Phycisphaerales bacterium]|nr:hypothetical protein [Phycisphaerales bacterium]